MTNNPIIQQMLCDPVILRLLRDICPKKGSGMTVTLTGGGRSRTLTSATRERVTARLRRPK